MSVSVLKCAEKSIDLSRHCRFASYVFVPPREENEENEAEAEAEETERERMRDGDEVESEVGEI